MPSKEQLRQAQVILELQEENENFRQREWARNRARQEQEGYIHDLMAAHYQLVKAIGDLCMSDTEPDMLAKGVLNLIQHPPSSVAAEREKRKAVFNREDKVVQERIADTVSHAKDKREAGHG